MKKNILILFFFISISICSCSIPFQILPGEKANPASEFTYYDYNPFPSDKEIDSFLSPYLLVLDDIKKTYGISLQITTSDQKKELYSHCIGLSVDSFKAEVMNYLKICDESPHNLPQKECTWEIDAEIIHEYRYD